MMSMELRTKFQFEASHSLGGFEEPHLHVWHLEIGIKGDPISGRIIDLPMLRKSVQELVEKIQNTYLNENLSLPKEAQEAPTCESLSAFFFSKVKDILAAKFSQNNHTIQLNFASVALYDTNGSELGSVRVSL